LIFGLRELHVKKNYYCICESCYIWGPIEYEKNTNPDTMADYRQPKKKLKNKSI
jgi:hypothetical protein